MNSWQSEIEAAAQVWWDWMAPMAWQLAVLVGVLSAVTWLLRNCSARLRYALWLLVPIRLVLPPTFAFVTGWAWWALPAAQTPQALDPDALGIVRQEEASNKLASGWPAGTLLFPPEPVAKAPPVSRADDPPLRAAENELQPASVTSVRLGWRSWPFMAWSMVTALVLLRLSLGALMAWKIVRTAARVHDRQITDLIEHWRRRLRIRRRVQVRTSARAEVPMVIGELRPTIILPQAVRGSLSEGELEAVLIHELHHIARHDALVNLWQAILAAPYFFHPMLWLGNVQLRRLREDACDEATVASLDGQRLVYGSGIVKVAGLFVDRRPSLGVGVVESDSQVRRRLRRILDPRMPFGGRVSRSALILFVVLAAVMLPAAGRPASPAIRNGGDEFQPDQAKVERNMARLKGRVVDPDGNPLSNVQLAVVLFSHLPNCDQRPRPPIEIWDEAESGADGTFAMSYRKPPSDFYEKRASALAVLASHGGFGVSWKYLKFSDDETDFVIKLKPEQIRRGRLVNLEGQPVPGAKIHVFSVGVPAPQWQEFRRWPWHHGLPLDEVVVTSVPVNADGSADWEEEVQFHEPPFALVPWPKSTTTDADGRFAIRGTGRDQRVQFVAYTVDKGGSLALDFDMTSEAEPEEKTFASNELRLIEGVVSDADTGEPVAGAQVRIDAIGTSLLTAKWPLIADWKGRQNHLSKMYAMPSMLSEFPVPPVFTETDADGRFRVSPIRNPRGPQRFRVTVSAPGNRPYVAFQQTIDWPRHVAFEQEVAIKLRPGVRVRGQVVHEATGQPVARARVDFWSEQLPYHFKYRANPLALTPDGDVHPAWRKADFDGRFEVIVPRGRSYLFVNEGTDDNEVDRIDAAEVGMKDGEQPLTPQFTMVVEPLSRSIQPHHYYPDRVVRLDFDNKQPSAEIRVTLRKARVVTINVVLPDGKPATDVLFYGGQEPFKEQTDGKLAPIQKTGEAKFQVAHRVDGPICVAFYSPRHSAGAVAELTREEADEPVTIKLQPVGSATVRFMDGDGKALADYRPLVWMSLPKRPYSGAKDLERLAQKNADGMWPLQRAFDAIWTAMLDKARYGDLKTDANGKVTLPSLIPGATYRLSQFNGEAKVFSAEAGATVNLGDIVVFEPDRTKDLPVMKPASAEQIEAAEEPAEAEPAGEPAR